MNAPMAMVAMPGAMMGRAMRWKMASSPAPSMRGASRMALGMTDRMYCRRKNTVAGLATEGRISGQ